MEFDDLDSLKEALEFNRAVSEDSELVSCKPNHFPRCCTYQLKLKNFGKVEGWPRSL